MRQGIVLSTARKGVKRVECGKSSHGAGDHGYGVWRHEWDVVWRTPHSQGVVWWTGSPQHHIMWVQRVADAPAVSVHIRVLLHLQRHDLLLLSVGQIVCGAPLGTAAPVDVMSSFVLFIVKSSKGKDVEEKQGSAHSNGHGQLGGVVPLVYQMRLVVTVLGLGGEWSGVWALGHQNCGLWCAVGCFWWRKLQIERQLSKTCMVKSLQSF